MGRLKGFTQSLSAIIVGIIALATGLILGVLMNVTGLTSRVDAFGETSKIVFLTAWLISRLVFSAIWAFGDYFLVDLLHRGGWFWFRKRRESNYKMGEEPVDKSGQIFVVTCMVIMFGVVAAFVAELTIRLTSWTEPFYFPPPTTRWW
jgi:hypothetical protein